MRKTRIKILNNKYIIAYHIKINKETNVFSPSKIVWINTSSIINYCGSDLYIIQLVIYIYFNFTYP